MARFSSQRAFEWVYVRFWGYTNVEIRRVKKFYAREKTQFAASGSAAPSLIEPQGCIVRFETDAGALFERGLYLWDCNRIEKTRYLLAMVRRQEPLSYVWLYSCERGYWKYSLFCRLSEFECDVFFNPGPVSNRAPQISLTVKRELNTVLPLIEPLGLYCLVRDLPWGSICKMRYFAVFCRNFKNIFLISLWFLVYSSSVHAVAEPITQQNQKTCVTALCRTLSDLRLRNASLFVGGALSEEIR